MLGVLILRLKGQSSNFLTFFKCAKKSVGSVANDICQGSLKLNKSWKLSSNFLGKKGSFLKFAQFIIYIDKLLIASMLNMVLI